ncbi:hypothetical protein [Anabaena catenula]|uniref:Uncharacterized protein n=1 Tax=Anabaena catenula FACHB-362 TaxID=2692877 RepID=A0ABR8J9H6_9NOST|nr:hypothetical protein [Anabaena catenula]MBD2694245.1 hypothetical protein [Anabaena catenula FACHB-362]
MLIYTIVFTEKGFVFIHSIAHCHNPLLSTLDKLMKLRYFSQRRIKVLPYFDRRGISTESMENFVIAQ